MESEDEKKNQDSIFWYSEMSVEGNFLKLAEISKKILKFQCPNHGQSIPKLINSINLDEIFKIVFLKNFHCCHFPIDAHCGVSNLRSMKRFLQILMLECRMQKFLKKQFEIFSKLMFLLDTSLEFTPILVLDFQFLG